MLICHERCAEITPHQFLRSRHNQPFLAGLQCFCNPTMIWGNRSARTHHKGTNSPKHLACLHRLSMPLPRFIAQRINKLPDFVALAVDLLRGFLRQLPMYPQLLF